MISAGDFRKGVTVEIEGKVYVIVDFQHVKPGKGAAFVRAKIKNVVTGDRKSTRLYSSHPSRSRMPSSA